MTINVNKINSYLSTLNIFLIIIGFAFVTTLFLPMTSDVDGVSRRITVPYRIFCLLISLIVLWMNIGHKTKWNIFVKILLVFWGLYLIKLVSVISFYPITVASQLKSGTEYYFYAIGIVFIPMLSVIFSYKNINTKALFVMVYLAGLVTLALSMSSNIALFGRDDTDMRQAGNVALNTIYYGHLAITISLLSLYYLLLKKGSWVINLMFVFGFVFSLYISLLASSRSPIFAFVFVGAVLLLVRSKNWMIGLLLATLFVTLIVVFWEYVSSFISTVSPMMARRLDAVRAGDSSDRNILYRNAWEQFVASPIIGDDFVLNRGIAKGIYPHNIILESLISLGFLGGIMIIALLVAGIYKSVIILRNSNPYGLIAVLFLQYLVLQLFSGSIYGGYVFFALLGCILMIDVKEVKEVKELRE